MKIDARDGNTTRKFRPNTDRGALAHFLDGIKVGETQLLTSFIRMDGDYEHLSQIQIRMNLARQEDARYITRRTPEGLRITRLA